MTAQIWPFKPRAEMVEILEWQTDVLRAKSAEQRFALRTAPRRTFNLTHLLSDYQYSAARAMVRSAQGDGGFLVPDWGQLVALGAVSPASEVVLGVDLSHVDMGDQAILWESSALFERVSISIDSNGVTLGPVVNTYRNARIMPIWPAQAPEGLLNSRSAGQVNEASIALVTTENNDLAASAYEQYRSLDVMPDCPVVGGGQFEESIAWPVSVFDNDQGVPHYIRQRSLPDVRFQMRWHKFTGSDAYTLRQWLHARRGQQRAFWISSRGHDFEPAAAISSTTVKVFDLDGIAYLGRDQVFDIDITSTAGTSYYRRVTLTGPGGSVAGRNTVDMTIDSGVTLALADIKRISIMRCARFSADRLLLRHRAASGMDVQVPCIEVPEP